MPAKLQTICYLHSCIFIPLNQEVENNIEDFENEQVIFLKGKFIAHEGWYSVTATSIKVLHEMNFDTMPAIGINAVLTGVTTQTYLGDLEPKNFWLEVKHKANNRYFINKTSSINQNSRSTTAILVGIIKNVPPINDPVTNLEISPFKFVLDLEDISLIYNNNYNNQTNNNQTINAPWLNPRQPNCVAREASPRTTRRRLTNTLTTALNSNPLPNMNFVLDLEDISLIYNNNYNNQTNNNQTINAPWLNPRQPNCVARGASPRTTRRRLTNTLTTALNSNPLPNMNVLNSQQEQPEQSEQSKPPTKQPEHKIINIL
ncbi:hypothetical protein Glove_259g38 [Diversispora epigaea]|uniref:Uncharacterized protein n=1 Tax=Diversispora epigaea TaxID=1348612 RepID=A0A397I6I8_9GLOM|nr:hypothetical protein Glove_259g38 [Diversispora epigaea]